MGWAMAVACTACSCGSSSSNDSGLPPVDATEPDGGTTPDLGVADLGVTDQGVADQGFADATPPDSGIAAPSGLPDALVPPTDERPIARYNAAGYQIYTCVGADAGVATPYVWNFTAPTATLTDDQGTIQGKHYAGPTWQSIDGSWVKGSAIGKVPSPDGPSNIPWLLLKAVAHSSTVGIMTNVDFVQRLHTNGGTHTATHGCDGTNTGSVSKVPYTATYYFYSK
jgi:hypothetical protein